MTQAALKIITDAMETLGLNYSLGENSEEEVTYPYFVGEYEEIEPLNEDGMQETTFLITGYSRESWQALEDAKAKIKKYFPNIGGKTTIAEDGTAVVVFYSNSLIVPTADAELKKIQINLDIKEWSVN